MARTDIGTLVGSYELPNIGDRERVASMLGGAVLILNGLVRPSGWHTLLALGGVELMRRGITGRSNLYRVLGVDRDVDRLARDARSEAPERRRPVHADHVDRTVDDSFPASDPPAWTVSSGAGAPVG